MEVQPVSTLSVLAKLGRSKVTWGLVVILTAPFGPLLMAKLYQVPEINASLAHSVMQVQSGVGAVLALWGRMTASGPLIGQAVAQASTQTLLPHEVPPPKHE